MVISTLNGAGFAAQPALAKAAAKAGGVKLFVPSEFGNPTAHLTDGVSLLELLTPYLGRPTDLIYASTEAFVRQDPVSATTQVPGI